MGSLPLDDGWGAWSPDRQNGMSSSNSSLPAGSDRPAGADSSRAGALWRHLIDATVPPGAAGRPYVDLILEQGTLARRIHRAAGPVPDRDRLAAGYRRLCECLAAGRSFTDAG